MDSTRGLRSQKLKKIIKILFKIVLDYNADNLTLKTFRHWKKINLTFKFMYLADRFIQNHD